MARLHGLHGRAHRGSGRQAVVHENDNTVGEIGRGPVAAILALAPLQFLLFLARNGFDGGLRYAIPLDDVVVEDTDATGGNRTHGELAVSRRAELANEEDIQR